MYAQVEAVSGGRVPAHPSAMPRTSWASPNEERPSGLAHAPAASTSNNGGNGSSGVPGPGHRRTPSWQAAAAAAALPGGAPTAGGGGGGDRGSSGSGGYPAGAKLFVVASGAGSPCMDFRRVPDVLAEACIGTDLLIIEGMGRCVHTAWLPTGIVSRACWRLWSWANLSGHFPLGMRQGVPGSPSNKVVQLDVDPLYTRMSPCQGCPIPAFSSTWHMEHS